MKKASLIISVIAVLVVAYSFTAIDKFPDNIPEESVTLFNSEYVKTINNDDLNRQLEQNFLPLFDKVTAVDAQYSEANGYYYIVFGEKDSTKKIELVKVNAEDIKNQTYTYFDFSGVTVTEATEYCYRGSLCVGCVYQPAVPCGIICGPYPLACN